MLCQPYVGGEDHQARDNRQEFLIKSARWCDHNNYQIITANMGETVIQNVREDMSEAALGMKCSHIFFIDDDMIVPTDTLSRLMKRMRRFDIISPLTFQRIPPFSPVMYRFRTGTVKKGVLPVLEFKPITKWTKKVQVPDAMGFGCVLMKTSILKKLPRPWFSSWTTIGEDIYFSYNAAKAGFKLGVDTTFAIGHLGDRPIISQAQFEEFRDHKKVTYWKNQNVMTEIMEQ